MRVRFWKRLRIHTTPFPAYTTTSTPTMTTRLAPRARRALLYLQGFDGKKIAKASAHPTLDCACLDMEDGVGISMKQQAREGIVHALCTVDFGRTECVARINAFDTGDLALRDLDALIQCPVLPDAICVPKTESADDIVKVSEQLDLLGDKAANTRIIAMIESATAVLNMPAICAAAPHRFDSIIFVSASVFFIIFLMLRLEKTHYVLFDCSRLCSHNCCTGS